jgi:uncharacterized hydrophobic protein (TIGR00271 family)
MMLFDVSKAAREQTYRDVRDSHQMRFNYLTMLVLACLVALFGLLGNSPAVVIGAMLISPLMSPFLSAGLALAIGDSRLGRAAFRTIALSVITAVGISALAVGLSPLKEATPEILSRTNPNLLDLGIAFFSGFAGTYTLIARKGGTTLPGVAIATAVMPPLCVVGFGVYQLDMRIALGALSLFVTNLAAIIISAATVFLLGGFRASDRPATEAEGWSAGLRLLASFVVLILLSIPLAVALANAADAAVLRRNVEIALRQTIERDPSRAKLASGWEARPDGSNGIAVDATARTVSYFNRAEVAAMQNVLAESLGKPVTLRLEQIRVQAGGLDPAPDASTALGPTTSNESKPPGEVTFQGAVDDYRPAAELGAASIDATLDHFLIGADDGGIRRIEIDAIGAVPPPLDAVATARRAVAQWFREHGVESEPPDVTIRVRPAEGFLVDLGDQQRARRPDLAPARDVLDRVRLWMALNPSSLLRLVVAGEPNGRGITIESVRDAVVKDLGIAEVRVIGPDEPPPASTLVVELTVRFGPQP